jgi:ornithine cyclodeaminase
MKFIPEDVSAELVTHELAYEAIRNALIAASEDGTTTFPVVQAHGSDKGNLYGIKSASTPSLAGLKVGSYWPGNDIHQIPRHNSIIFLFDQIVGRIGAAVEAGRLNGYRTAAADALAADVLARPDSSTLALFGAGHQAEFEVQALARIRNLSRVLVVARNPSAAEHLASILQNQGIPAVVSEPETACRSADIIVTVTTATAPLFQAQWVQPGTHIASMGSDATGKQELPTELFRESLLFCDLPSQSRMIGEFQHAPKDSTLSVIGAVLSGRTPGRQTESEVTIFDSSGLSVQDLFIARAILELHAL